MDHEPNSNIPNSFVETLARVDERTVNIDRELRRLMTQLSTEYVPKADFNSLAEKVALHQRILFGTISAICLVVLGALLTLVVKNGI